LGNIVRATNVSGQDVSLDVNDLKKGIYLYKLTEEDGTIHTGKFIIEK